MMKSGITLFACCALMANLAWSGGKTDPLITPWNKASLRLFGGVVANAASMDSRGGYSKTDLGNELEWGGSWIMPREKLYEYDLTLSSWSAKGRQYNADKSGRIDVEVNAYKLSGSYRQRYGYGHPFVPWWDAGPDIVLLTTQEQEHYPSEGGLYPKDTQDKSHMGFGAHIGAGCDIYPVRESALALFIEARGAFYITGDSFDGNINGVSIWGGLRWDFWPR